MKNSESHSSNILQAVDQDRRIIMCHINGHQAFPIIFAYITKSQSGKRLLCMQCFKEDTVIDKKLLLELAKLSVDYGQVELARHRAELRDQLRLYIASLNDERNRLLDGLSQDVNTYKQEFLLALSQTEENITNAINQQIKYRIEMVTQNMERQINLKLPEEIVEETLYANYDTSSNYQLELILNQHFTNKGKVLYDRFNRQCFDLQRVDYMLNSRVTVNEDQVKASMAEVVERVRSMMADYIVPDVQKHEQLTASTLKLPTSPLADSIKQEEAPMLTNLNISKHQFINVLYREQEANVRLSDWLTQFGVKGIIADWKELSFHELKSLSMDQYPSALKKSVVVFIKVKDDAQLKSSLELLQKAQNQDDDRNENTSLIISKDLLTSQVSIKKVFEQIKLSGYAVKNLWFSLSSHDIDEKYLQQITTEIKGIVSQIKFLHLDLSSNKLGDSSIQLMRPILRSSENLRKLTLNLELNGFGHHGCQQLSSCLLSLRTLTLLHLNLNSNKISDNSCSNLAEALKHLQNLTHLALWLSNNMISEVGMKNISHSIASLLNLTHVLVAADNNRVTGKGISFLFEQWHTLTNVISMELYFKNNQIQGNQLASMENMLVSYQNLDELKIDFSQNSLGDAGVMRLAQAIAKKRFLKGLWVHLGTANMTRAGVQSIAQAINLLHLLEELSIDVETNGIDNAGAQAFGYGLKNKVCVRTLELKFNLTNLVGRGFQSITEEILQMVDLKFLTISLANNNLEDIQQLIASLAKNPHLEYLKIDLSHTMLNKQAVDHIGDALKQCKALLTLELNIQGNKITDEQLVQLAQHISSLKSLNKVVVWFKSANNKTTTFKQVKTSLQFVKDLKVYL